MQDIMEKFEFFPIKCRTERARQLRRRAAADKQNTVEGKKPLKTKVSVHFSFTALHNY
jgi:hypothetical protein